jgi:uncharacterized phage protein gp47/JayE
MAGWPIPAPGDIANRGAAIYEQELSGIDARSTNTVATTNTRITEMAMQDLYFYQGNVEQEMFVDTATDNLARIAGDWGVPQDQPSAATGYVIVTGLGGKTLPAAITMTSAASQSYVSTASATIPVGSTSVSIPVQASVTGSAGNLAANAPLTITSPVDGLTSQTATVDSNGLTGGADLESPASWAARIKAKIRKEPSAGDFDDYVEWCEAALPNIALAACPPGACGGGVVSVVFLMAGFVPPTSAQIAQVAAYIQTKRPVTADVNVYAGTLNPVPVTLHLNPDTPAIRAAATAALALSFQQDAAIGGTTYLSRLNNAVSSSDGEYSHELVAPTADVAAPSLFALNTLGPVSFV